MNLAELIAQHGLGARYRNFNRPRNWWFQPIEKHPNHDSVFVGRSSDSNTAIWGVEGDEAGWELYADEIDLIREAHSLLTFF